MTPYSAWLDKWQSNLEDTPSTPHILVSARNVNTPLIEDAWGRCLTHHPNQPLTRFSLQGLREGFHIGFNSHFLPNLKSSRKNLEGAIQHPAVVDKYLEEEVALGRVAGPFRKSDLTKIQISRFGVIPKSHQKDKWRLIIDLSHPKGNSVNNGIPKPLCGLSYITIDDAINGILRSGPNTLLAKIDIKSAFRLLPVHPADRHLLAMEWKTVFSLMRAYRSGWGQHPSSSTFSLTCYPGSPRREDTPLSRWLFNDGSTWKRCMSAKLRNI